MAKARPPGPARVTPALERVSHRVTVWANRLINVETLSEHEVRTLHGHYERLIALARREGDLQKSHSIEEAEARHHMKQRRAARS